MEIFRVMTNSIIHAFIWMIALSSHILVSGCELKKDESFELNGPSTESPVSDIKPEVSMLATDHDIAITGNFAGKVKFSKIETLPSGAIVYHLEDHKDYYKIVKRTDGQFEYHVGRKGPPSELPLQPDIYEPLFEQSMIKRLIEIGDGPFTIGASLNGYPSKLIARTFLIYDGEMQFTESYNAKQAVCNFTKTAVFSEVIDFSKFYWHHPDLKDVQLQTIDDHTYCLTKSGKFIHFSYEDYHLSLNEDRSEPTQLFNSEFYLCDFGANPMWKTSDGLHENIKQNSGKCDYENDTDIKPVFSRNYLGSTLGFFIYEDEIYITSLQLFQYANYMSHSVEASFVAVVTSKVEYNSITTQIENLPAICIYQGKPKP